jgi:hypothetical protein
VSASRAAKLIKEKFGLGSAPQPTETLGNLDVAPAAPARGGRKRKAEKMAQLNLHVPEEVKDRVRILAARDRREMSEIVIEAIALYEERFGPAPKLEPSRRA